MSETFTRRSDKILGALVGTWLASVLPLGIAGFWWHPAWALIAFGLAVCWLFATATVYDRRYDRR